MTRVFAGMPSASDTDLVGIGAALLRRAFDIARAEGYGHATLHVDSENSNAAPAVYLAAGFDVRSASDMYTLTLTR